MDCRPYRPEMAADWDAVTEVAPGGTVMQSRRFLDYHGTRFRDISLVGGKPDHRLSVVFPLAVDPAQAKRAISHPGTSFGGVISLSRDPSDARSFLRLAAQRLLDDGFDRLLYRAPPAAVLRQPDDGLLPDLVRMGTVVQLDLWSILPLPDSKAAALWRSKIRRAERQGLCATPVTTAAEWAELHGLLSQRLLAKYGKGLVHSLPELIDLHHRLGRQSRAQLIRDAAGNALAGHWFIDYGSGTLHNQYNGATDQGLAMGAAGYGIALTLEAAQNDGFRALSLGRSTESDGFSQNRSLLEFKSRFGTSLAAQLHFDLDLRRLAQTAI